jgi:hypothetical protein
MNLLTVSPLTRINDNWIRTERINGQPVTKSVKHPIINSAANSYVSRFAADFYSQVAMDIVNETVFHYPYPYITEKTLRPINCKRMFILFAPAGQLSYLQGLGIQTFDDIIDESYDQIKDPEQRFLAVEQAIRQFCKLGLEEIRAYYHNNQARFKHNFDVIKNLRRVEIDNFLRNTNV